MLVLEREQTERKDSESAVGALKRQLASIKEKCNKVDIEIDQVKAAIAALRKGGKLWICCLVICSCASVPERRKEGKVLESQAGHQEPELRGLESKLHCTVEGVQSKHLLHPAYTHILT